ncbi:MAG: 2,3,4,5-tetrahydropyridine-2,6-dicarboxylate N-succinyltransferase [Proteobacteria bacterium]|nr:2,3,4,5-tetrahydropyridine-2,6-dicarboxylate N-succinyltransferase [Pseudomonadota bacterium]
MSWTDAKDIISGAWEASDERSLSHKDAVPEAIERVLAALDTGELRVAEKSGDNWMVHDWIKKAILISFRLADSRLIQGGPGLKGTWFDKVPSKFQTWGEDEFKKAGFRVVPGALVRRSAYIAPGAVLMPCFINVGARVGVDTMVDSWATVGSCAQVGDRVHISGGVGIGGVLEPVQARPVIIEDDCFIGARSEIAEGVIVETGAVLSMGVYLSQSTVIYDRQTGQRFKGRVPAGSVVVPGTLPGRPRDDGKPVPALAAAIIVKKVDARTRSKTSINKLLRQAMADPGT